MKKAKLLLCCLLSLIATSETLSQDEERKDWFFAVNVDGVVSHFEMDEFGKNILEPMQETWGLESTNISYGFGTEVGVSLNQKYIEMAVDGLYMRRNINGIKPVSNSEFRLAVEGIAVTHSIGLKLHNFGREINNILRDEPKWNATFRMKLGMARTAVWREDHYIFSDGEDDGYTWGQNRTTLTWANEIDAGWNFTNSISLHLGVGYRVLPIGKYRRVEYTGITQSEPDVKYGVTMTGFYGSLGLSYRLGGSK
ncbi:MAG: hypothetical protein ACI84C_001079 [Flavobacteriales bacterium]|jgi:hypothetical protein